MLSPQLYNRYLVGYELGEISQAKAAEIAGLTRAEFINALSRYKVDFMQYTVQELAEEPFSWV